MRRVAVYLRQSVDVDGGNAIARQRAGCFARISALGWAIADVLVYVDNGISATSGKTRPAYDRLLEDVRFGLVDVVVAWNLDRLSRRPRELEDWFDLNRQHGVNLLTSEGADLVDLSTETGRLVLRLTIAVASMEGDRKARRQRESNVQERDLGLPPSGRRAFGYTSRSPRAKAVFAAGTCRRGAAGALWPAYGHEPLEPEATAVRSAYRDILAGVPLYAIARALNRQGLTTTLGNQWRPEVVRLLLCSPRPAALVRPPRGKGDTEFDRSNYDLTLLRPGTWEPLVSLDMWYAAQTVLRDPRRRTNPGNTRAHLLSGLAHCGHVVGGTRCGALIKSGSTNRGLRSYRCPRHHFNRQGARVDELVTEAVLARLRSPAASRLLLQPDIPATAEARNRYAEARARRDALPGLYADGALDADGLRHAARNLDQQLAASTAQLTDGGRKARLGTLISASDPAVVWARLSLERRRAVIELLLHIEITSPGIGQRTPRDYDLALEHTARTVTLNWKDLT